MSKPYYCYYDEVIFSILKFGINRNGRFYDPRLIMEINKIFLQKISDYVHEGRFADLYMTPPFTIINGFYNTGEYFSNGFPILTKSRFAIKYKRMSKPNNDNLKEVTSFKYINTQHSKYPTLK